MLPLISPALATTTLNVSNNSSTSNNPAIAVSDSDDIYIVWEDAGLASTDIYLATSIDGYASTVNVSDDSGASTSPAIAISSIGDVYVVWRGVGPDSMDIFLASSTDTYSSSINVSNNSGASFKPAIAVADDGTIYIAWADDGPASRDIFLASSIDSYAIATNVSNNIGTSAVPRIAISSTGDVYIAWQDNTPGNADIFLASSIDSYAIATNVSNNSGASANPAIAISDSNDIYIVWQDDNSGEIFLASSTDSYASTVNVSNSSDLSSNADLALFDDEIYVTWKDADNDEAFVDVYSAKGTAEEFGDPVNISENTNASTAELIPRIAVPSDGNAAIVWSGDGPDSEDIILAQDIVYVLPTITINDPDLPSPKWDVDEFVIEGAVSNAAAGDTVSVDWGDSESTDSISISGDGSWSASHTYDSSAVSTNPNQVVASVVGSDSSVKNTSNIISVNVAKHETTLSLEPIASILAGSNMVAEGFLIDTDTGEVIQGATITFDGTGAANLDPETTAVDGSYSASGASPTTVSDLLAVQAAFDGDDLYSESSAIRTYDTVDGTATTFVVSAGSDVHVDLAGFDASVDFDEIETAGDLFVSTCNTPVDSRYVSMDLCLRLSSGFIMASGSDAHIAVSFNGTEMPDGYSVDDISIFHETTSGVVDITESKDIDENTVTGITDSFSNFIVAAAVHDSQPAGSVRKQVFVGDGSGIALRDMSSPESPDAEISLNKSSYKMSDTATLTIIDDDANLNIDEIDSVTAIVTSETSGTAGGIDLSLEETGINTGTFVGAFTFTSGASSGTALQASKGDEISVSYDQVFGARFEAVFEDVEEAGVAQVSDFVVEEDDEDAMPFHPRGYAVELELLDVSLAPGADITLTISYANAFFFEADSRELLKVYRADKLGDGNADWEPTTISTVDSDTGHTIGVDTDAKTVTVTTTQAGIFMLGYNIGDPGGGGGGLPRPGSGLVLDAVAAITTSSGGGSSSSSQSTTSTQSEDSSSVDSGNNVSTTASVGGETVNVTFDSVQGTGSVDVTSMDISQELGLFSGVTGTGQGSGSVGGSEFSTTGTLFNISTTTTYSGPIQVTIPYNEDLVSDEQDVRFLHYGEDGWEDATIAIDMEENTVTGSLDSLSPVVAAVIDDGTFGSAYFEVNPMHKISTDIAVDSDELPSSLLSDIGNGPPVMVSATIKNVQRADQTYVFIVQILDTNGITKNVTWQQGTLERGESIKVSSSWFAAASDTYTVQVFVWDSIEAGAAPLSDRAVMEITV